MLNDFQMFNYFDLRRRGIQTAGLHLFTLSSNKVSSARPVSLAEIGLAVLNPPYCLRVKMPDSSGLLKWVDH